MKKNWTKASPQAPTKAQARLALILLIYAGTAVADPATNAQNAANQPTGPNPALLQIARDKAAKGDSSMLNALQIQQAVNHNASNQNANAANSARAADSSGTPSLPPVPSTASTVGIAPPPGPTAAPSALSQIVDSYELRHAASTDGPPSTQPRAPSEDWNLAPVLGAPAQTANSAPADEIAPAARGDLTLSTANPSGPAQALPQTRSFPAQSSWNEPPPSTGAQIASMRLLASLNVTPMQEGGSTWQRAPTSQWYRPTWASRAMPSAQLVAYLRNRHSLVVGSTEEYRQRIPGSGWLSANGSSSLSSNYNTLEGPPPSSYLGSPHNISFGTTSDAPAPSKWTSAIPAEESHKAVRGAANPTLNIKIAH